MKDLAVIIPVKSSESKSRLSKVMSARERRELSSLLLAGVLGAVGRAGLIDSTWVVSSDRRTIELAEGRGARTAEEDRDSGVNSAVSMGISKAGNPQNVLVLPSDLPLVRPREIGDILAMKRDLDVVIVPSRTYDGTNALAFSTDGGPTLSYDNDSFWNHIGDSAKRNLSVGISTEPGIVFDLDSPADLSDLKTIDGENAAAKFARRLLP